MRLARLGTTRDHLAVAGGAQVLFNRLPVRYNGAKDG